MKSFYILISILFSLTSCLFLHAQELEKSMTQGEFVMKLTKALGLDSGLSESDAVNEYAERLRAKGIEPDGGFQLDKIITKDEKAQLLMKSFQLEKVTSGEEQRAEFFRDKAVITYLEGDVQVKFDGAAEWIRAEKDMKLSENDYIRTGVKSLADLIVGTAGRVRIKENTELLLKNLSTQAGTNRETVCLYLAMGEAIVDVNKVGPDSTFLTTTPTVTVGVRGTIYKVKVTEVGTAVDNP